MSRESDSNEILPISLFDYELPTELIAQQPLDDRSDSRLMVLDRESRKTIHSRFRQIGDWLRPGDLLVLNDTRVFPARLIAKRKTGGRIELLLLEELGGDRWLAMARPVRRLRAGETLTLLNHDDSASRFRLLIREKHADGVITIDVSDVSAAIREVGRVPLPHYITQTVSDPERYQTVYSQRIGSVAAPTAGLHFTDEHLESLQSNGIEIARLTLHVGPGTFQPVKVEDALLHQMHAERFVAPKTALEQVRSARGEGRRVIAVGTTSCRTLESIADRIDQLGPLEGSTSLYITPGYQFQVIDGLLTNFHLPRSTLMLLVSAFASRELVLRSYHEAIAERYRFYSFGDAMLIV